MVRYLLTILLFCNTAQAQLNRQSLFHNTPVSGCVQTYPAAATLTVTSGLTGWWKADVGITISGGHIAAWADQSGNGYTLTPVATGPDTGSACPIGTRVRWEGVGRTMINSSFPNLSAVTVLVVKHSLESQNASHAGKYTSAAGGWMLYDNGTRIFANAAITTTSIAADTSLTQVSMGQDATDSWIYRNGVLKATGPGLTIGTNTVPFEVSGYQNSAGGTGYGSTGTYTVETYEILVYNRKLTSTERADVEFYLKTRWGTP